MQYVRCFRLYVSANSAALPMSHWRYELCITYPYYASLSGACTWEGYGLRITYPHYVSSTESPPERAMYYALRIRIMYQAPKARRRGLCTTHYVSVLCIKRRKPAGEVIDEMRPAPRLKYGSQAHRSQSSPALNAWVLWRTMEPTTLPLRAAW